MQRQGSVGRGQDRARQATTERGKAEPDKEWEKAWWNGLRADKNSTRTVQDETRAGRQLEC